MDNLLAVTFDDLKFNLVDCEKQLTLHKEAPALDTSSFWGLANFLMIRIYRHNLLDRMGEEWKFIGL